MPLTRIRKNPGWWDLDDITPGNFTTPLGRVMRDTAPIADTVTRNSGIGRTFTRLDQIVVLDSCVPNLGVSRTQTKTDQVATLDSCVANLGVGRSQTKLDTAAIADAYIKAQGIQFTAPVESVSLIDSYTPVLTAILTRTPNDTLATSDAQSHAIARTQRDSATIIEDYYTQAVQPGASGTKTFYGLGALSSGSNFLNLQDGGTAPTDASMSPVTGWVQGTNAVGRMANMDSQNSVAAASFSTTAAPSSPDNTIGNGFRTPSTLRGTFAAGNWTLGGAVQGGGNGGQIRLRFDVYRSTSATGASATRVTTSTLTGNSFQPISGFTQTSSVVWSAPSFSVDNEYIFVTVGIEVTSLDFAAGSSTTLRQNANTGFVTTALTATGTTTHVYRLTDRVAAADSFTEDHTLHAQLTYTAPDTIAAADQGVSVKRGFGRVPTDPAQIADTYGSVAALAPVVTDPLALQDFISVVFSGSRVIHDQLALADQATKALGLGRTVTDGVLYPGTDTPGNVFPGGGIQASDSYTALRPLARTPNDQANLVDATARALARTLVDSALIPDTPQRLLARVYADAESIVDSVQYNRIGAAGMAPDAIISKTNLAGTVSTVQDDPDTPGNTWMTVSIFSTWGDEGITFADLNTVTYAELT